MLKKSILSVVAIAACVVTAQAQAPGQNRPQPGQQNQAGPQPPPGVREKLEAGRQQGQQNQAQQNQAQQTRPATQNPRENPANQSDAKNLDGFIADGIALANQEEIALAQVAAERAQNQEVKQFAQTMVREHQQMVQKLRKFTTRDIESLQLRTTASTEGAKTSPSGTQPGREGVREAREGVREARQGLREARQDVRGPGQPEQPSGRVERRAGYAPGDRSLEDQLADIRRDAAQECLQLTTERLNKKQGAEFDRAFLSQQANAHVAFLAALNAIEPNVSPELQQVVREGQQSVRKHLEQADRLQNNLEQQRSTSGRQ